jgi:hypothetical protein
MELNQLRKWTEIQANARLIGDIVLISEDNMRKSDWTLGRIEATHSGRDGLVRSVTVKTKKGLMRRAIQCLRLLEAANDVQPPDGD